MPILVVSNYQIIIVTLSTKLLFYIFFYKKKLDIQFKDQLTWDHQSYQKGYKSILQEEQSRKS